MDCCIYLKRSTLSFLLDKHYSITFWYIYNYSLYRSVFIGFRHRYPIIFHYLFLLLFTLLLSLYTRYIFKMFLTLVFITLLEIVIANIFVFVALLIHEILSNDILG